MLRLLIRLRYVHGLLIYFLMVYSWPNDMLCMCACMYYAMYACTLCIASVVAKCNVGITINVAIDVCLHVIPCKHVSVFYYLIIYYGRCLG